jgi:hypothetical protein
MLGCSGPEWQKADPWIGIGQMGTWSLKPADAPRDALDAAFAEARMWPQSAPAVP